MKKGDYLWGFALLIWIVVLVVPSSREIFMAFTGSHPIYWWIYKVFNPSNNG